ncbi:nuclear transport factor 2 family protein [Chitinophaga sp. G-6-1-13]|uniref:Nuclear transport factor 2 family protein n=1 Tax=Chitinophaga fulva TaxID=2728842 RepID=A0A848GKW6_9BACT|nr:nuclear transport factor 2 family protein [Chitinophaga fulva]NML38557.1 nuclear transport factor 2 family protein [Chitinophaga fulva]
MEYIQDAEIISVLENYAEALRMGNIEQLQKTFHGDAIMYGYWDQHLVEGGIANLYDSVARHGAAPHLKARIEVLHKAGNIALVRVEYENNAAGKDGVDYHSLIKINGEWRVIAKLFQTFEK